MTPKRLPHFFIQEVSFVHGVQTCLPTKVADRLVAFLPPTIFSGSNVEFRNLCMIIAQFDIAFDTAFGTAFDTASAEVAPMRSSV
jgi:hypothetical protein